MSSDTPTLALPPPPIFTPKPPLLRSLATCLHQAFFNRRAHRPSPPPQHPLRLTGSFELPGKVICVGSILAAPFIYSHMTVESGWSQLLREKYAEKKAELEAAARKA